jgi:phosphoglycerate dehydrogenase-like enzyme
MKAGAFFVNTSRAQVVDYGALYELLKEKRLAGAALDVYYSEPPQSYDLSKLENVVSTPHLGYYTKKSLENQLRKVVESIVQNF